MKEQILAFLEWVENNRATYLYHDNGYSDSYPLWDKEVLDLVEDYIKSQEEE